jgi:hypothetical protein
MFDLHVHSAPCVMPRLADDVQTVTWYEEAGFSGCVLKGHCEPTVGRAVAAGAGRRIAVYGGVVLNHVVGGLNPSAVDAALRMGARVVWFPTVDARAHHEAGLNHPSSCAPSVAAGPTYATPPVDPTTETPVRAILDLAADADAVLATGHVSSAETAWLVTEASKRGVNRLLLTHPSFTVPAMSASEVRQLCELGAVAEVTAYQLLHQPDADAAALAAFIRDVGYEHCVLSSDAGQPTSPPGPDALRHLVERLAAEGLDRGALRAMAADRPQLLVAG